MSILCSTSLCNLLYPEGVSTMSLDLELGRSFTTKLSHDFLTLSCLRTFFHCLNTNFLRLQLLVHKFFDLSAFPEHLFSQLPSTPSNPIREHQLKFINLKPVQFKQHILPVCAFFLIHWRNNWDIFYIHFSAFFIHLYLRQLPIISNGKSTRLPMSTIITYLGIIIRNVGNR